VLRALQDGDVLQYELPEDPLEGAQEYLRGLREVSNVAHVRFGFEKVDGL